MWVYEKKLQFPVNIKHPDPAFAKVIISQIGGPDGELSASMRYMSQRYAMPLPSLRAMLTDISTEELSHLEMVSAMIYQLTQHLSIEEIKESGFDVYFVDHTTGIYPQAASGTPHVAAFYQSKGDPIADLIEDMAAEQKARVTYDNLLRLTNDEDIKKPLRFLREREIVHFQRFGEALTILQKHLQANNYYQYNPSFDTCPTQATTSIKDAEEDRYTSCMQAICKTYQGN